MGANKVARNPGFFLFGAVLTGCFPGGFPGEALEEFFFVSALEVKYFEGQTERSRHQASKRCSNAGRWISLDFGVAKYKGVRGRLCGDILDLNPHPVTVIHQDYFLFFVGGPHPNYRLCGYTMVGIKDFHFSF